MLRIVIDLDVDGAEINDLYLARGALRSIINGYEEDQVEAPESLIDKLAAINMEISARNRAELQRKLKNAKARREGLATVDEKRTKLDEEIAKLEKMVGPTPLVK